MEASLRDGARQVEGQAADGSLVLGPEAGEQCSLDHAPRVAHVGEATEEKLGQGQARQCGEGWDHRLDVLA